MIWKENVNAVSERVIIALLFSGSNERCISLWYCSIVSRSNCLAFEVGSRVEIAVIRICPQDNVASGVLTSDEVCRSHIV